MSWAPSHDRSPSFDWAVFASISGASLWCLGHGGWGVWDMKAEVSGTWRLGCLEHGGCGVWDCTMGMTDVGWWQVGWYVADWCVGVDLPCWHSQFGISLCECVFASLCVCVCFVNMTPLPVCCPKWPLVPKFHHTSQPLLWTLSLLNKYNFFFSSFNRFPNW